MPLPIPLGTDADAILWPPWLAAVQVLAAASVAAASVLTAVDIDTRTLAATAYGEGSSKDVFEEMAAIANVLVRQQLARGHASVSAFIKADKTFAFAAHDGNGRYAKLMAATIDEINQDAGMAAAVAAAINALDKEPVDHANGAYFWDGADIKTKTPTMPRCWVASTSLTPSTTSPETKSASR